MASLLRYVLLLSCCFALTMEVTQAQGSCPLGCLQGQCTSANTCQCKAGWTNLLGLPTLPCATPNCTLSSSCLPPVNGAPPPVPQSPAAGACTAFNFSCGGGTCETDLTLPFYRCVCYSGFVNMFNFSAAMCVQECAVDAQCSQINTPLGGGPPSPRGSSPLGSDSKPNGTGSKQAPSFFGFLALTGIIVVWLTVP